MTDEEKRVAIAAALFARFVEDDDYRKETYELQYMSDKMKGAWKLADLMVKNEPKAQP